jgi:hypothetical protein
MKSRVIHNLIASGHPDDYQDKAYVSEIPNTISGEVLDAMAESFGRLATEPSINDLIGPMEGLSVCSGVKWWFFDNKVSKLHTPRNQTGVGVNTSCVIKNSSGKGSPCVWKVQAVPIAPCTIVSYRST